MRWRFIATCKHQHIVQLNPAWGGSHGFSCGNFALFWHFFFSSANRLAHSMPGTGGRKGTIEDRKEGLKKSQFSAKKRSQKAPPPPPQKILLPRARRKKRDCGGYIRKISRPKISRWWWCQNTNLWNATCGKDIYLHIIEHINEGDNI